MHLHDLAWPLGLLSSQGKEYTLRDHWSQNEISGADLNLTCSLRPGVAGGRDYTGA